MDSVFTTFRGGFGDCWGAANYFLKLSEWTKRPTLVCQLDGRIRSIIGVLDTTGSIQEVNRPADILICGYWLRSRIDEFEARYGYLPDRALLGWTVVYADRYLKTKQVWRPTNNRVVVYQLVPRKQGPTTCGVGHIQLFLERMQGLGFETVPLGDHLTIEECVSLAAKSRYFVGVDSGMSHLCHSVRTPVHLIRNGHPRNYVRLVSHKGNPCSDYADIPEFLASRAPAEQNHDLLTEYAGRDEKTKTADSATATHQSCCLRPWSISGSQ